LDSEAFGKKYGIELEKEKCLVFYCHAGVRGHTAAQTAQKLGFKYNPYLEGST